MEGPRGVEPRTHNLKGCCSANWAKGPLVFIGSMITSYKPCVGLDLVGIVGIAPTTSRLSSVRSKLSELYPHNGANDGTWTRGLRRDRPAL